MAFRGPQGRQPGVTGAGCLDTAGHHA